MPVPTIEDIRKASERIRPHIHRTPVLTCESINRMVGGELFFKCENFQKVGAFKFRGACNAVFSLGEDEAARGVATHSSGNHAAAMALAARKRGIKAYVVMPENAPQIKKDAVAGYGAEITFCTPTLKAREEAVAGLIETYGATLIHPFNDHRIIAGQGTAALELLEEISTLDLVIAPIGGGGLACGTALVVDALSPDTRMVAAEPKGADDAFRSFQSKTFIPMENPKTIADGLLTSLGDKTFPIVLEHVDEIVTVSEAGIVKALRIIWERMKILVEPSSAVPLGALVENALSVKGKRAAIILSGGNMDLTNVSRLLNS